MSKSHNEEFINLVKEAKKQVNELTVPQVKQYQASGMNFKLVDVREDSEWEQGHIPEAIHLGKGVIERDIEKTIPDKNTTLVLYCGGGFRSALAAESIQKMGYQKVYSMDGGYRAWKKNEG